MSHAFQINPREVLGVGEDATLSELHEAYRNKSKKHHPDVGGEEWAFRIVTRAYELLSTARVMGRADEEMRREEASRAASPGGRASSQGDPRTTTSNPFSRVHPTRSPSAEGQSRSGVRDQVSDSTRLVAVEMLLLRYELDGPATLLLGGKPEDRNLSCNLNIEWPCREAGMVVPRLAAAILPTIQESFRVACKAVPPSSASSRSEDGRFVGLISHASALQADEAFKAMRKFLRDQDCGVVQTIHEIAIPRTWQS